MTTPIGKLVRPPTPFADTYMELNALLNTIRWASSTGKVLHAVQTQGQPPGSTTTAAKAYGDAYGKAKGILKPVVDRLSPVQLEYLSGLGFTDPGDDAKKRTDVLNSVVCSYDTVAAKYMKGELQTGDAGRPVLLARLSEFDDAIIFEGKPSVTPDK